MSHHSGVTLRKLLSHTNTATTERCELMKGNSESHNTKAAFANITHVKYYFPSQITAFKSMACSLPHNFLTYALVEEFKSN